MAAKRLLNPRRYRFSALPPESALLFYAQRVQEALFEFSLDSYKVPALNTHSRCLELLRTLDEVDAGHVYPGALRSLFEEIADSVAHDRVARQLVGVAAVELCKPDWWVANDVDRARVQAQFLRGCLWKRRYEQALREELLALVPLGREKERIYEAATSLLVEWMNLGFSHDYIYFVSKRFFWGIREGHLSPDSLRDFFTLFDAKERPFTVIVRIGDGWAPTATMLNPAFAELVTAPPPPRTKLARENAFLEKDTSAFLILKDIRAREPRSAAQEALSRIRTLHSAVILHRHQDELDWDPECLIYDEDRPLVLRPPRDPMHREEECEDAALPARITRALIPMSGLTTDDSSATRLQSALGLHSSAVRSDEASVQLLSLWSGIEALLPASGESARILDIRERLVPVLSASYPLKLLRHLHESLLHCVPKQLEAALSSMPGDALSPLSRLAALVCLAEHEVVRKTLLAEIDSNPLLRYRLWHLAKSMSSPHEVRAMMRTHEARVAWHVERVYRTRNLLVHSGRHFPYLDALVENVHRYFHRLTAELHDALNGSPPAVGLDAAILGVQLRVKAHLDFLATFGAKPYGTADVLRDCLAGPGREWTIDVLAN